MAIDILRGNNIKVLKRAGGIALVYVDGKIVVKATGWLAKRLEGITDSASAKKIIS